MRASLPWFLPSWMTSFSKSSTEEQRTRSRRRRRYYYPSWRHTFRMFVMIACLFSVYFHSCVKNTSNNSLFVHCLVPLDGMILSHAHGLSSNPHIIASHLSCRPSGFKRVAENRRRSGPSSTSSQSLRLASTSRSGEERDLTTTASVKDQKDVATGNGKNNVPSVNDIPGLLLSEKDLKQWQTTHETLKCLQRDFPDLWIRPMSSRRVQQSHSFNTEFILHQSGLDEPIVLAKNRQELVQLQNSAALAIQTPLRATEYVLERLTSRSATPAGPKSRTTDSSSKAAKATPIVDCRIILPLEERLSDNDDKLTVKVVSESLNHIKIEWSTSFPSLPSPSASSSALMAAAAASPLLDTKLKGVSRMELRHGKIARHEVTQLRWKRRKNKNSSNSNDDNDDDDDEDITNSDALMSLLGQTLTQGRSTIRTLEASIATSPLAAFLPPDLQKGTTQWIQQQVEAATSTASGGAAAAATTSSGITAPIFVQSPRQETSPSPPRKSTNRTSVSKQNRKSNATVTAMTDVVPIDEFVYKSPNSNLPPLPGSRQWNRYVTRHKLIRTFVEQSIPALAEQEGTVKGSPVFQFAPQAKLYGMDKSKTLLLESPKKLTQWYHFLATWRRRTISKWILEQATAIIGDRNDDDKGDIITAKVRINYHIEYPTIPTTGTVDQLPSIRGTDLYTISFTDTAGDENTLDNNNDSKDGTTAIIPVIESVHQEKLVLAGAAPGQQEGQFAMARDLINNNHQDGTAAVLFMRSMITAMENDFSVPTDRMQDDGWWMELLPRGLGLVSSSLSTIQGDDEGIVLTQEETTKTNSPPLYLDNDEAAATVYRIMVSLHQDGLSLVDTSSSSSSSSSSSRIPSVSAYMTDQVELRGLLGEVLIRGRTTYQQTYDVSIGAPLRTALRSRIVESIKDPTVQVELTNKGTIRSCITLHLRIVSTPLTAIATSTGVAAAGQIEKLVDSIVKSSTSGSGGTSRTFPSLAKGAVTAAAQKASQKSGVPLTLSFKSEYVLDSETGRIVQHLMLESRVNDILTPENVFSQWIQQQQKQQSSREGPPSGGDLLFSSTTRTVGQVLDWLIRSNNNNNNPNE